MADKDIKLEITSNYDDKGSQQAKQSLNEVADTAETAGKKAEAAAQKVADTSTSATQKTQKAAEATKQMGGETGSLFSSLNSKIEGLGNGIERLTTGFRKFTGAIMGSLGILAAFTAIFSLIQAAYDKLQEAAKKREEERKKRLEEQAQATKQAFDVANAAKYEESTKTAIEKITKAQELEKKAIEDKNAALKQSYELRLNELEVVAQLNKDKIALKEIALQRQRDKNVISEEDFFVQKQGLDNERFATEQKIALDKAEEEYKTAEIELQNTQKDLEKAIISINKISDLEKNIGNRSKALSLMANKASADELLAKTSIRMQSEEFKALEKTAEEFQIDGRGRKFRTSEQKKAYAEVYSVKKQNKEASNNYFRSSDAIDRILQEAEDGGLVYDHHIPKNEALESVFKQFAELKKNREEAYKNAQQASESANQSKTQSKQRKEFLELVQSSETQVFAAQQKLDKAREGDRVVKESEEARLKLMDEQDKLKAELKKAAEALEKTTSDSLKKEAESLGGLSESLAGMSPALQSFVQKAASTLSGYGADGQIRPEETAGAEKILQAALKLADTPQGGAVYEQVAKIVGIMKEKGATDKEQASETQRKMADLDHQIETLKIQGNDNLDVLGEKAPAQVQVERVKWTAAEAKAEAVRKIKAAQKSASSAVDQSGAELLRTVGEVAGEEAKAFITTVGNSFQRMASDGQIDPTELFNVSRAMEEAQTQMAGQTQEVQQKIMTTLRETYDITRAKFEEAKAFNVQLNSDLDALRRELQDFKRMQLNRR